MENDRNKVKIHSFFMKKHAEMTFEIMQTYQKVKTFNTNALKLYPIHYTYLLLTLINLIYSKKDSGSKLPYTSLRISVTNNLPANIE